MSAIQEVERILPQLSLDEKAGLVNRLQRELASAVAGVSSTLGVCGGAACIAGTRIAVFMLEEMRLSGMSDAAILEAYPHLKPSDLAAAWEYVRLNPSLIENQIRENNEA